MKTPRFTLRTLLLAVALSAFTIQSWVLWRRSKELDEIIQEHEGSLAICNFNRDKYIWNSKGNLILEPSAEWQAQREYWVMCASYEEKMVRKYRRAKIFPWFLIESDPPTPMGF